MKKDIQEHYDSLQIKKALQELHITKISELKEFVLARKGGKYARKA